MCGELPEIQSKTATFMLAMNLITGSLSVYIAPKLGSLSDRYGRTRFLALSSCGGLAAELVTVIVAKYPETFDYRWLILGSICDGLTGSFTAGSVLAQAYIADCTAPSKRAVALGYIQACLFSGLALGPLLAGYFVEFTGSLLSFFYVALGCHSFFILFIFFATPDSLTPKRRQIAQEKWDDDRRKEAESNAGSKALRIVNPLAPLRMLWPRGPGTSPPLRRNLVALALSDTIIMTSSMGAGPVILLYSRHVFQWNTLMASQFISALSSVRVVALMVLLPAINYLWRVRPAARLRQASGMIPVDKSHGADRLDLWILRAALISDLVGVFGYTFAKDGRIFFLSGMLTAIGGLGSAIIQSVVTKHVPRERTGQILGAIGMMHALARVLGPIAFNGIYAITVKRSYPQAAFVLLGGLFVVALVASAIIKPFGEWKPGTWTHSLLTNYNVVHWEEEPEPEADLVYPAEVILHTGSPPPPLEEDPLIVR